MGRYQSFNNRTKLILRLALIFPIVAVAGAAKGGLPNDDCASAQVVTDGAPAAEGDNSAADATDDAEAGCSASDNDVWFQYVATCSGTAGVDTFGSGQNDTVLSVYDACGGNEIVCNDDTGGTLSQVFFAVAAGQSYWIRLASIGLPGDFDLNIACSGMPGNDTCAKATLVTDGAPAAEGDSAGASVTDDAEATCGASDKDVWFEYVATCTGSATADTFGSGPVDTVLSVYDACGGNEIACNDDTTGLLSEVSFATTAGQSSWIRLASIGTPGDYDLNILCSGLPGNDECASAMMVSNGTPAAEGDNSGASATDDAEANCAVSDGDVWFAYIATSTGVITVDTFGSGQADTVLSVYDACGGKEIACNDDSGGLLSQVSFASSAGQHYRIRLASLGVPGDYDLNISSTGALDNDNCLGAALVTDGTPAVEGDNAAAGAVDDAEATCGASDGDVWFEYVAMCAGTAIVDTFGSAQDDTVLSAYDACGGNEIACNDDTGGTHSQVLFAVTSGQSYWIRLASVGLPGDYHLNISCSEAPGNDNCTAATVITEGTPAFEGENAGADATDDTEASCTPSEQDVWFEYVATCSGHAFVDTVGSEQPDTVLSVYDACGGNEIICNDDTNGSLSAVSFVVTSGQSYWIRLASVAAPGDYDLNVSCSPVPTNDDCASATPVINGPPPAEGNNAAADDTDDAEASCGASDHDVWFEYVSICAGAVTVDTFGSEQPDTVLSVYDACGGNEVACNDDANGKLSLVAFESVVGQIYWIRLASIGAGGDYDLTVLCAGTPEAPTMAAFPDDILKNRYLSIDPRGVVLSNVGRNLDIRVTLVSTLVNGVTAVGSSWWATASDTACIAVVGPTRPTAPPNWDACPTLHLTGCPIIPTSTYDIVMIDGIEESTVLAVATQARPADNKWWGDAVGEFTGSDWTPPQGVTNFDDVTAAVKTFINPGAINATHTSVTDVHPNRPDLGGNSVHPNRLVSVDDVFQFIQAFQGADYPGAAIDLCPDP